MSTYSSLKYQEFEIDIMFTYDIRTEIAWKKSKFKSAIAWLRRYVSRDILLYY